MPSFKEYLPEAKSKWIGKEKVIIPVKGSLTLEFSKTSNELIVSLIDDFQINPAELKAAYEEAVRKACDAHSRGRVKIQSLSPPYSDWVAKNSKNILNSKYIEVISTIPM